MLACNLDQFQITATHSLAYLAEHFFAHGPKMHNITCMRNHAILHIQTEYLFILI